LQIIAECFHHIEMKILLAPFIIIISAFALSLLALSPSWQRSASRSAFEAQPTATPILQPKAGVDRAVSEPYTGDLAIFEAPERDINLQIDRVMDILKITEGKSVADIGAGSGWFTVRAAKRVGEKGKVFAVEINQEYIDHIAKRALNEKLPGIQTVLGKTDDPLLPLNSLDSIMILKTYHEIGDPVNFLKKLRPSLRKDGLMGIIDRNGSGDDHGIEKATVIDEAKRAGFAFKAEYDFVKPDGMDYFLVFEIAK